jgi:hypothetical protein
VLTAKPDKCLSWAEKMAAADLSRVFKKQVEFSPFFTEFLIGGKPTKPGLRNNSILKGAYKIL